MYLHLRSWNFYFFLNECLNTVYQFVAAECEISTAVSITVDLISTIHAFIDGIPQNARTKRCKNVLFFAVDDGTAQTKFRITGGIRTAAISAVFRITKRSDIEAVIKINVLGVRGMVGQQECTGTDGVVPVEINLGVDVNIALSQFFRRNKGSFWLEGYLKRGEICGCTGNGQVVKNTVCFCNLFCISGNIFFCGSRNASRKRGSESGCKHTAEGNGSHFIFFEKHKDSFLFTGK